MSDFDDLDGVTRPHIPDDVAEQMLDGTWTGDGTNQHLADVAALLNAARTPADASELASIDATLAAFRGAVGASIASQAPIARTQPMRKKLFTAKTAAAIGVITLATAGAAAAAGTLSNPFAKGPPSIVTTADGTPTTDDDSDDTVVDDSLVDDTTNPTTGDTEATTPSSDTTDSTVDDDAEAAAQGPDATGPAKFGLCTAYDARTKHDDTDGTDETTPPASTVAEELPIPFANLEAAAEAAGQSVDEFCADATPGRSADAPGQQDGNPSATAPGHADDDGDNDDNPSATAPGHADDDDSDDDAAESSDATANGASNPSQTAPGRSGDHGSGGAGQGNGKG